MKPESIIQALLGLLITIGLALSGWNLMETVALGKDTAVIKEQVGQLSGRLSKVEK
jgi:hypothetical protein